MIEGSGIDIVDIEQIEKAHKKWGDNFLKRVFTERETSYSFEKRFPYQHLAARFAAKEAVLKSFANGWRGLVALSLIEILNDNDGKPYVRLKGSVEKLYKERKLTGIVISMSHSKNFAVASCILVKNKL